jgi:hypothetical protein
MKHYLTTKTHQGQRILALLALAAITAFPVSLKTGMLIPGLIGLAALIAAACCLPQYLRDYRAMLSHIATRKDPWR